MYRIFETGSLSNSWILLKVLLSGLKIVILFVSVTKILGLFVDCGTLKKNEGLVEERLQYFEIESSV